MIISHALARLMPASLLFIPLALHAQVTFLNGGYSEYCATVARQVDDPENMVITGSRLGISPLEVCTRAIAEGDGNRAASYNNRGVLYFAQGDYDAAVSDFESAIAEQDDVGVYHINKGLALIRLERWEDSIAAFDRGIALGGDKLDQAYYNRGVAHEETGDIAGAYYDYKAAAELNPEWDAPREELKRFSVR